MKPPKKLGIIITKLYENFKRGFLIIREYEKTVTWISVKRRGFSEISHRFGSLSFQTF
jgi:hypothetical protein